MKRQTKIALIISAGVLVLAVGALLLSRHSSSGSTTGQQVNAAIDNLKDTCTRLTELPLTALLLGAAILSTILALPLLKWGTVTGKVTLTRTLVCAGAGVALFTLAMIADRKISYLQARLDEADRRLSHDRFSEMSAVDDPVDPTPIASAPSTSATTTITPAIAVSGTGTTGTTGTPATATKPAAVSKRTTLMIDKAKATENLKPLFGAANLFVRVHDQATDVAEVDFPNLPAIAYMAVINLKTPGLEVKFGGSLTQKTMTTDFAKANNCVIAINGEAGISPLANSGLGTWSGNMMVNGTFVRKEDPTNRRPFLTFDKDNNATFTALAADARSVPANAYNVIWGRLDAIINDKVQTEAERDRQPRTGMGISKDGTKLFLMVVDGRQQRYSVGFTRQEVGAFMQAFGASNGMLCDEGGSSCIYMKSLNGIVNRPSDGEERATYTHFGISLKAN